MARKIVIVDDEPTLLYLLRVILKTEGYRVTTSVDGREALSLIDREEPNLVIMDLRMPGFDGWDLVARLRDNPRTAHLPIIILSVQPCEEDDRAKITTFGVFRYMTKPFEPLELVAAVKAAVR